MKVTFRWIVITDKYGLRLNHPRTTGFWRKVDKFLFKYYKDKFGLPCFLPLPKLKRQLTVDGKAVYSGGGVNCFNQPLKTYPITVSKKELLHCKRAALLKRFKVRNFSYNGFSGQLSPGYANYTIADLKKTNDPGIYCGIREGGLKVHVPGYAIEGVQIFEKIKESKEIPILFGSPSNS